MSWHKAREHRKLTGRPWRRLRQQVLKRDKYLCQCAECAQRFVPLPADEVDHVIPLAKGGTDSLDNLRAISAECHKRKTQVDSGKAREGRLERRRRDGDHWSR